MVELQNNQKEIYNYLKSYSASNGYPPSVREICAEIGLKSTSTAHGHLRRLEKKGLIKRDPARPRALKIIDTDMDKKEMLNIPIIKDVLTDNPILSCQNILDTFAIPLNYIKDKSLFMLRVFDSNMINAKLFPGDLAIFEECTSALNNDIILTKVNKKTIIARFSPKGDYVILEYENDDVGPLIVSECVILGKLVGVFRTFN